MQYAALYDQLVDIVHGEVFEVTFYKKDGTIRTMKCTLTDNRVQLFHGLLPVWDMEKSDHRSVNLKKVIRLSFDGKEYYIEGNKWAYSSP